MMLLDLSTGTRRLSEFTIPDSADWDFSGDFTIELFKVVFATTASQQRLIGHYNTTSNQQSWLIVYGAGAGQLWFNGSTSGSSSTSIVYAWTPSIGTEYNIAVDRSGSTVRLYVDGAMVASGTISGALFGSNDVVSVGAGRSGSGFVNTFTGTCKAIRVTKDVARYATNGSYTVPSLPLPTG